MKHTPGPWHVDPDWALIMGPNGEEIAAVHSGMGDGTRQNPNVAAANSYLLATAPDLLAALVPFAAMPCEMLRGIHCTMLPEGTVTPTCKFCTARATYARAKGEN